MTDLEIMAGGMAEEQRKREIRGVSGELDLLHLLFHTDDLPLTPSAQPLARMQSFGHTSSLLGTSVHCCMAAAFSKNPTKSA